MHQPENPTYDLYTQRLAERFWQKVYDEGGCWSWRGATTGTEERRGRFHFNGKMVMATHIAWLLANGCLPSKLLLHTCDNGNCVNPSHLYEGDYRQNAQDAVARNRLWQTRMKACKRGHEFYYDEKSNRRRCRTCLTDRKRELSWLRGVKPRR